PAGNAPRSSPAYCSFSQTAWTWAALTPALASRLARTDQGGLVGLSQACASWPPWAPSTITRCELRFGYCSALCMNAWNSCVVLDIPIEMSTTLPLAWSTGPEALRGSTWLSAMLTPADVCAAGRVLLAPGYSPPDWPW